ncbi:MAG: cytochrome b/b6 domain-containing protein [Methylobacteriaceae bacterium]|nr:cytochrome b/b6 domain-containing protein [Methylobacteriaceae bacterium]
MNVREALKSGSSQKVLAWDLPTRIFKWGLVLLVADAWISNKFGGSMPAWHKWNGYAILVLIVFRLLWGFVGGSTSRFAAFAASPSRALVYARDIFIAGRARRFLGHNPAGAYMIFALLIAVALQAIAGLYSADEDRLIIEGPLAKTISDSDVDRMSSFHASWFNVILVLAAIHIAVNLLYGFIKRDPVIQAMISGSKPRANYEDQQEARPGAPLAALACGLAAIVVVFGGIFALGGNPLR